MALPLVGPAIAAALRKFFSMLLSYVGPLIVQAFLFLGITFTTAEYAIEPLLDYIAAQLAGAPAYFLQVVGYVGGDIAIGMVLSAYATRAASRLILRRAP